MSRVRFAVEDAIHRTAASTYGSEFCSNHPTYKVTAWCADHEISICMVCLKLDHAKCRNVQTLEDAVKEIDSQTELKSLKHRIQEIRNIFKRLVKDRKTNIEGLEKQKKVLREDVTTFKERIYQHLERLEHKLKNDIDLAMDKHKSKLQDQIFDYETHDEKLASIYQDLVHLNEDSTENHRVIFLKEASVAEKKEDKYLEREAESLKTISVQLQMDETIRKAVDVVSLAYVKTVESTPTNPPDMSTITAEKGDAKMLVTVEESVKEYNKDKFKFEHEGDFDVKPTFSVNALVPELTGGLILEDGRMFVVDKRNSRLMGYINKGKNIVLAKETFMENEPYAITYLDVNKLVCTVPSTHSIEIRDYGALQFVGKKEMRYRVSGISSYDDIIVVVCENHGLYILDIALDIKDQIHMKGNKDGPVHLLGNTICYAEYKKGIIHVMDLSGEVKFKTTVKGLGYVEGVAVLRDSSLLVTKSSPGNRSTWHFSPDGLQQALREEFEFLKTPRTIVYEKKAKKLFIANGVRAISVFKEHLLTKKN